MPSSPRRASSSRSLRASERIPAPPCPRGRTQADEKRRGDRKTPGGRNGAGRRTLPIRRTASHLPQGAGIAPRTRTCRTNCGRSPPDRRQGSQQPEPLRRWAALLRGSARHRAGPRRYTRLSGHPPGSRCRPRTAAPFGAGCGCPGPAGIRCGASEPAPAHPGSASSRPAHSGTIRDIGRLGARSPPGNDRSPTGSRRRPLGPLRSGPTRTRPARPRASSPVLAPDPKLRPRRVLDPTDPPAAIPGSLSVRRPRSRKPRRTARPPTE